MFCMTIEACSRTFRYWSFAFRTGFDAAALALLSLVPYSGFQLNRVYYSFAASLILDIAFFFIFGCCNFTQVVQSLVTFWF